MRNLTDQWVERIARFTPLGYQSKIAEGNNQKKWVQVDLGGTQNVDSVKLYPFLAGYDIQPQGFSLRFCITASKDSNFKKYAVIADYTYTRADYPDTYDAVIKFPSGDIVKRLRPVAGRPLHFSIKGDAEHQYVPYYEIGDNSFSCYPAMGIAKNNY